MLSTKRRNAFKVAIPKKVGEFLQLNSESKVVWIALIGDNKKEILFKKKDNNSEQNNVIKKEISKKTIGGKIL